MAIGRSKVGFWDGRIDAAELAGESGSSISALFEVVSRAWGWRTYTCQIDGQEGTFTKEDVDSELDGQKHLKM